MLSKNLLNYTFSILFTLIINSPIYASSQSLKIEFIEDKPSSAAKIASSPSTSIMPFKLGFEFQEATGLCPWAQHNALIQKKKLFEVSVPSPTRILWHMVIDSNDIEFVTEPFAHNEKTSLELCMRTITDITTNLAEILNSEREITFDLFLKTVTERMLSYSLKLDFFDAYQLVQSRTLSLVHVTLDKKWEPSFVPQATIQHPLEYTIPLYFSLFGFDNNYMPNFSASLPLKDEFLEAQRDGDGERLKTIIGQFKTKLNGLVFLHALTMTSMSPTDYPSINQYVNVRESREVLALMQRTSSLDLGNCTASLGKVGEYIEATQQADTRQLADTLDAFTQYDQVDPKMSLVIMSRRPFSSMFKDIPDKDIHQNYAEYFNEVMAKNLSFRDVQRLFNKVNYAEQFFDSEQGTPRNLSFLEECLKVSFLRRNSETVSTLLQKGIVSTTMVRNFNENVLLMNTPISLFFENYFNFTLMSVDNPTHSITLDLNSDDLRSIVKPTKWSHDLLSPPLLLDKSNSMGRFREKMTQEEKLFGEAIIEVRGIKSVKPWFLNKIGLAPELSGIFLVNPKDIEKHSLGFFIYLNNFISNNYDCSIFETGLSHALRKY